MPPLPTLDTLRQQYKISPTNIGESFTIGGTSRVVTDVCFCANATWGGSPPRIHAQAIAQHYGFATNLLDTTNSFDVACFLQPASLGGGGNWRPVTDIGNHGVIYTFPSFMFSVEPDGFERHHDVGWQPLHRPAQQRATVVSLKEGQSFSDLPGIAIWHFQHDKQIAERLLDQFDGGKALFPEDPARTLADKAMALFAFTQAQIEHAKHAYETWRGCTLSESDLVGMLNAAGISKVESSSLTWDCVALERDVAVLHNRLAQELRGARVRLVADHLVAK